MSSDLEQLFREGWEQIEVQVKGRTVFAYKTPPLNGIRRTIRDCDHLKEGEKHLASILFPNSKTSRILKASAPAPTTTDAPAQSTSTTPNNSDNNQKRSCPLAFDHQVEREEQASDNNASAKRLGKIFNTKV